MKRLTWMQREILKDAIWGICLHLVGVLTWLLAVAALLKYLWKD